MKAQMTIFDILPKETPLGYIKRDDVQCYRGRVLTFSELADCIELKVLMECPREGATDYKVVLVKRYLTDSDKVYRWESGKSELIGICDRVSLSDDNRKGKANMWVSEMHCRDGRYCTSRFPHRFYTIKGEG